MPKKSKRRADREPVHYDPPSFEEQEESEAVERPKYRLTLAYLIDQEEVNMLVAASTEEFVDPPESEPSLNYETYTMMEAVQLVNNDYKPPKKAAAAALKKKKEK